MKTFGILLRYFLFSKKMKSKFENGPLNSRKKIKSDMSVLRIFSFFSSLSRLPTSALSFRVSDTRLNDLKLIAVIYPYYCAIQPF